MSRFRSWSQENWHPSEDELFCYADSELKPAESQRIKTHLEACWACRVKVEKVQANIASFVTLLDRAVTQEDKLRFPPRRWRMFEANASNVMSEFARRSRLSRWSAALRDGFFAVDLPFRLAGGFALLLLVGTVVLRLHQTTTVSASEILQNAAAAEVRQTRTPTLQVVYQKLQVRRKAMAPLRDDSVTWEIWNDSSSGRFAHRAAAGQGQQFSHVPLESMAAEKRPRANGRLGVTETLFAEVSPILLELGQIFRTNRIDGRKPLSSSNYETWRKGIDRKSERVEERRLSNGGKGLVLSTDAHGPYLPNSIIQADLVVRVEDWHPVAEVLRVQGDGEIRDYELTETEFDLLALNSLSPAIFADIRSPATRPLPQMAHPPAVITPAPAELLASEIMVRYALHRAKACLGEPVEIQTSDLGGIEVRGLAETPLRKAQLIAALQDIPLVTLRIQTLAEAQATMRPPRATPANSNANSTGEQNQETPEGSVVTVRASKLPIQDGLKHYFTQSRDNTEGVTDIHQRIATLSSQAISLADATLADAFALRQLAEEFPSTKTESLSASNRWLLEVMVRDHLQSIQTTMSRSRSLLEPVLRSLESGNEDAANKGKVEIAPGSHWTGAVEQLFGAIERMERLTAFLFAGASLPDEHAGQAVAKLLAALDQIEQESRRLVGQGSLPDRTDSATLIPER